MGQRIEVDTILLGDAAVFDTDRSITGQDGAGFARGDDLDDGFPARLASRLFDVDAAIEHVFVASNQVVVLRTGGWDEDRRLPAAEVIRDLFVFYDG